MKSLLTSANSFVTSNVKGDPALEIIVSSQHTLDKEKNELRKKENCKLTETVKMY